MSGARGKKQEYVFLVRESDDAWTRQIDEREQKDERSGWF